MSIAVDVASSPPHPSTEISSALPSSPPSVPPPPPPPLKLFVIINGTSRQGASVCQALLLHNNTAPKWKIRILCKNKTSPKALEFESKGVEILTADLTSKSELAKLFEGAYGVFGVTNYWEPDVQANSALEEQQAIAASDAAADAKIKHLIWSGAPDIDGLSKNESLKAPHYAGKVKAERYIRLNHSQTIPHLSFLYAGFFYQNLEMLMQPLEVYGEWQFHSPLLESTLLPVCGLRDFGNAAVACLENPDSYGQMQVIPVVAELLTLTEICHTITAVTNRPARHVVIPLDSFADTNSVISVALMRWLNESYKKDIRIQSSLRPFSPMQTFKQWLIESQWLQKQNKTEK